MYVYMYNKSNAYIVIYISIHIHTDYKGDVVFDYSDLKTRAST